HRLDIWTVRIRRYSVGGARAPDEVLTHLLRRADAHAPPYRPLRRGLSLPNRAGGAGVHLAQEAWTRGRVRPHSRREPQPVTHRPAESPRYTTRVHHRMVQSLSLKTDNTLVNERNEGADVCALGR